MKILIKLKCANCETIFYEEAPDEWNKTKEELIEKSKFKEKQIVFMPHECENGEIGDGVFIAFKPVD